MTSPGRAGVARRGKATVGIFGGSAQDDVDLREVQDRLARVESALASLQGQVAALLSGGAGGAAAAAGPVASAEADWLGEARRLKAAGNAIQAIKLYRERTGLGLKEAKDAVDAL